MLKSLEKLKNSPVYGWTKRDACGLADEIQAEVDKFYLPRPLFEDGEPVDFGDIAYVRDNIGDITDMEYQGGKCVAVTISFEYDSSETHYMIVDGERLKRPPEPDTQEKIDADYRNETNNLIVDSGRGCMTRERAFKYVEIFDELMARQRKLDGVER